MTTPLVPTISFDPRAKEFLADPYPQMNDIRASSTPVAYVPATDDWIVTRHTGAFVIWGYREVRVRA